MEILSSVADLRQRLSNESSVAFVHLGNLHEVISICAHRAAPRRGGQHLVNPAVWRQ
jgi:hypothetical protein